MAGGHAPVWSRDGSELFYAHNESLHAVPFAPSTGAIGMPRELFALDAPLEIIGFDVSPDAQQFLIAVGDQSKTRSSITILLDWPAQVDGSP